MQPIAAYLSAASTIVGLLVFLGIVWWAWSAPRQAANEESAELPFELPDEFNKDSNKDKS
jgi:cytochrome c oxidase cbb3-type subunit 4